MFTGPFFYLLKPVAGHEGLFADLLEFDKADLRFGKRDNPVSHQDLFDRLQTDIEYMDIPRGRVVYDTEKDDTIIYIDRCIEKYVSIIAKTFQLGKYRIAYDEHYVCPHCWNIGEMWC